MRICRLVLAAAVAALAGCGTSKEARELAIETAAAIQALDATIATNSAASKKAAAAADARIGNLVRRTVESRSGLQTRIDADSGAKSGFDELREFADKQEAERRKAMEAASAQLKALTDARENAKSPSPLLKEVSDNLTALGKEESVWERLKRTAQFVRDVAKRVKDDSEAAQNAAKQASSQAKAESEKPEAARHGK
jgi:hypothetical protein